MNNTAKCALLGVALMFGVGAVASVSSVLKPRDPSAPPATPTVGTDDGDTSHGEGDSSTSESAANRGGHSNVEAAGATKPKVAPKAARTRNAAQERKEQRRLEALQRELSEAEAVRIASSREGDDRRDRREGDEDDGFDDSEGRAETDEEMPAPEVERKSAVKADASNAGATALTYWNGINKVIEKEESMRAVPAGGITAANASDFTNRRLKAGEYAAAALRSLAKSGVDPELVAFGERLAAWYAKGVEIGKKGKWLLEKADAKTRKGPQGKQWQEQDKTHQQSVGLINGQGEQVRLKMEAKYRITFPPLK